MTDRARRAGAVALLVLFGLGIGLLMAEVGLRVIGWRSPGYYVDGRGPLALRRAGAEGGVYPPATDGRLMHYDYDVPWSVNAHGFRERPLTPKPPGTRRIGLLGDSFTAGVGIEPGGRYGDLWSASLQRTAPRTEVWNLATPVCGAACAAEILEGVGAGYDLDELVLAFYAGNDLHEDVAYEADTTGAALPHRRTARDWLREHSRTSTFVWVAALRRTARFQPPGVYHDSTLARMWPATERGLARLLRAAGERPLTILYLPALPEWSDDMWQQARQQWELPDAGRHITRAAVEAWARDHGVRFIDTTPWLQGCSATRDCIFPVDGHWNARGHRAVAGGLAHAF